MVADWYKQNGYHFLGLSDHNVVQAGTKWFELKTPVAVGGAVNQRGGGPVLEKYVRRYGPDWVEQREEGGKKYVRLKPLDEYRSLLEEPGRFLLIPMEEITSNWKRPKTATTPEHGWRWAWPERPPSPCRRSWSSFSANSVKRPKRQGSRPPPAAHSGEGSACIDSA